MAVRKCGIKIKKRGCDNRNPFFNFSDGTNEAVPPCQLKLERESQVNQLHRGFVVGFDGFRTRLDGARGFIHEELGRGDLARVEGRILIFALQTLLFADGGQTIFLVHGV